MMAVTGVALVLFVTFHVLMNSVALIWPAAYNQVCEFLGANWYALIASMGLAVLFIIHILYALWLTLQNRAARGNDRYAVTARQPQVEWSSKNMLVLGIVVVAFLGVHLVQFWAKMQLQEAMHAGVEALPQLNGAPVGPAQGTLFLQMAFAEWWTPVVYIIGFVALWFHMTHGFWSMFQTIGWDNAKWLGRLKCIANWWTSIVIALFVAQVVVFTLHAHSDYYLENIDLQEQYAEHWNEQAMEADTQFKAGFARIIAPLQAEAETMQMNGNAAQLMQLQQDMMAKQTEYINQYGPAFVSKAKAIVDAYKVQCSKVGMSQEIANLQGFYKQIEAQVAVPAAQAPAHQTAANQN